MTNKQAETLANRYKTTPRTIRRWDTEGAPIYDEGAMSKWLSNRKHLPPGMKVLSATEITIRHHIWRLWRIQGTLRLIALNAERAADRYDLGDKLDRFNNIVGGGQKKAPLYEALRQLDALFPNGETDDDDSGEEQAE